MKRIEDLMNLRPAMEKSGDANRFYSILLDSRASRASQASRVHAATASARPAGPATMCDIAEKLVEGEKENARIALEQLWALKKNLVTGKSGTIDKLIRFYQEKIDTLRAREESLRKTSREARELLEEKRKKDDEILLVRKQVSETTREIADLSLKLDRLTVRERDLAVTEEQLAQKLSVNEHTIVEGLSQIILSQPAPQAAPEAVLAAVPAEKSAPQVDISEPEVSEPPAGTKLTPEDVSTLFRFNPDTELLEGVPVSRVIQTEEKPPYPRWLIKTTLGRVIGEYFYDGNVDKEQRHYIFNSRFFGRVVLANLRKIRDQFDEATYCELLQMTQDAYKRITGNSRLHFEIAVNEILNEESLKQLWLDAKRRSYDEVERFCTRLLAKIDTMGRNYHTMLSEQMNRALDD
ncbi:MAG: hypothetical protein MUF22_00405 [Chitinispirillaceae bacterium]|jgi:hypothetical protein|nr:hypothetical protein [Chitinispirillaceae bacterium]